MISGDLGVILQTLLDALGRGSPVAVLRELGAGGLEWVHVNTAYASLLGRSVEEQCRINPLETISSEQRTQIAQLASSFRTGQPIPSAIELTLVHASGEHIPVEASLARREAEGGAIVVAMLRDLRTHQQLSLLEADRIALVGALAAGFAHEINNPLTSVLLNLRSLRKQLLANLPKANQPQAMRCVDDITTGAERIASNVRALQALATRSETSSIDLAAVVSSALRLAAPTLEPRAHVIRQIFPVTPVSGEESRIGQAVLAMMLFSISGFDPEMSTGSNRVVVLVEDRDADVVVEVSDNGRDLTPEEMHRAFDPFFRSHVRGAGVGVGLGVARSVAATLGGQVTLGPRVGGGAVITMRLPHDVGTA